MPIEFEARTCESVEKVLSSVSSNGITVSPNGHLSAFAFGKDQAGVVSLSEKKGVRHSHPHSLAVTDVCFNPFSSPETPLLATASKEGIVKFWDVPQQFASREIHKSCEVSLTSAALSLNFHPSAKDVLAVGYKKGIAVVDVGAAKLALSTKLAGFGKDILSVEWTLDGSRVVGAGKDKGLHFYDPRTGGQPETVKLDKKPYRLLRLSEHEMAVLGADGVRSPFLDIVDLRNFSTPSSSLALHLAPGVLMPTYDVSTQMLFVAARDTPNLHCYDLSPAARSDSATAALIGEYVSDAPIVGLAGLPKCSLDVSTGAAMELCCLTTDAVCRVTARVPGKQGFQADVHGADVPSAHFAVGASAYFGGHDAAPRMMSLDPEKEAARVRAAEAAKPKPKPKPVSQPKPKPTPAQSALKNISTLSANEKKDVLKTVNEQSKTGANRKKLDKKFQQSTFQHTSGCEPRSHHEFWSHLQPYAVQNSLPMAKNIVVNSSFMAVPWRSSSGSSVAVIPLDKKGRLDKLYPVVQGHSSQVTCLALSTLNSSLLATGADDGKVHLYRIPSSGLSATIDTPDHSLKHSGKLTALAFHDSVDNVLATASKGFDGAILRVWNVDTASCGLTLECHEDVIWDLAWSPNGDKLATTSKDGYTRVIDVRAGKVLHKFRTEESERDTRVLWMDEERVITAGFGARSSRSFSLWRLGHSAALSHKVLEKSNATLLPHYDYGTGLLFLCAMGETRFRIYDTSDDELTELAGWSSGNQISGVAWLSKWECDVMDVQIARCVNLSKTDAFPVSFTVPRKRKEFFQDDIFPPHPSNTAQMSASDFFAGKQCRVQLRSLQPKGVPPLSEAPTEELSSFQQRRLENLREQEIIKEKGTVQSTEEAIGKFRDVVSASTGTNRWDATLAQGVGTEVDEDEWDDED